MSAGNDTYVLRVGDGGEHWDWLVIHEEIGGGFDTIRIEGIAPGDVRVFSNPSYASYLGLSLPDGAGGFRHVDLVASIDGEGSDIGRRIERVEFDDGTVWDLTLGLTARLPDWDYAVMDGTPGGDVLAAGNASWQQLYGHDGDDLLIAATGNGGWLAGGNGDDTFVLKTGDGGVDWDPLVIREEIGGGFDTIRFEGIAPDDVRVSSSPSYGSYLRLSLPDGAGGFRQVDLVASIDGEGSDIGQRIERIEFDDGTLWDLTLGLTARLPDWDYAVVNGTPGDDALAAGNASWQQLYGHDGDDLLIAATGNGDWLAGGNGDDTFVLKTGDGGVDWSPLVIHEEIDGGFDTIRFEGIAPGDVRVSNSPYYGSYLRLSLPDGAGGFRQVDLVASIDGEGSDIGRRIERVEFDDGTVWDLTLGLTARLPDWDYAVVNGTPGGDVLATGNGGWQQLYGHDGDDLLIAATGNGGWLAGGNGDDTYVLGVGDGGVDWDPLVIREEIGGGFDTIRIEGIAPGDVRVSSSPSYGSYLRLSLPDGAGGFRQVDLVASIDGEGSDIGQRIERIEFDDGTLWDLTLGLTARLPDWDYAVVNGTPGDDVLATGNASWQQLYGHDGDDLLITATGNGGWLAGGNGNDTYVLRVGDGGVDWDPLVIHEEIGGGFDTIRIEGIAPGDLRFTDWWWGNVRMSLPDGDGGFGHVEFFSSANDLGLRIERFEFDDGTVWDVTQGILQAITDSYEAPIGQVLEVAAFEGVLANDTVIAGEGAPSAFLVSGPANGSVELDADGSFTYTPNAGFYGDDSFVYGVTFGSLTDTAEVRLTAAPLPTNGLLVPAVLPPGSIGTAAVAHAIGGSGGEAALLFVRTDGALTADPFSGRFGDGLLLLTPEGGSATGATGVAVQMINRLDPARISVSVADPAATIDWAELAEALRPLGIADAAWERAFAALQQAGGDTLGSIVAELGRSAARLSSFGLAGESAELAIAFELQQALDFGSLASRAAAGSMGQGWAFLGDLGLQVDASGDVVVRGLASAGALGLLDARAAAVYNLSNSVGRGVDLGGGLTGAIQTNIAFQKQIDGSYLGGAGSGGTLRKTAAGFELAASDGRVMSFDAAGRFLAMTDAAGRRTVADYDAQGRMTGLSGPQGRELAFARDASGNVVSVTDATGRAVDLTYSADGRFLAQSSMPGGTAQFGYTAAGDMASAAASGNPLLTFTYDAQGRLGSIAAASGGGSEAYAYDGSGGYTITDAAGRVTTVQLLPDGSVGRITDANGQSVAFLHGRQGDLGGIEGPDGAVTRFGFDAQDRLVSVTDANGVTVRFGYEGASTAPVSFTDANGSTRGFAYDDAGRLVEATWPDGTSLAFVFDADGNLAAATNRRGETITYDHDGRGNLVSASNSAAGPVSYEYDAAGRMVKAVSPEGETTLSYDAAGRVAAIVYPNGRSLAYEYDEAGRRTAMEDQDGNRTEYSFDAGGRLVSLSQGDARVDYGYDASGLLIREDNSNGTSTDYVYDAGGRLTSLVNRDAGGAVTSSFAYAYDAAGNRVSMATADGDWSFGYDAIGQLVWADFNSTRAGVADKSIAYAYDAAGNRVSATEDGVTTHYASNGLNQYTTVGGDSFAYDDDGNMVSRFSTSGNWSYEYDASNRLVRVTDGGGGVTEYEYDVFGNRTAQVVDGARTDYLIDPFGFGDVVAEYGTSGLIATYLHGLGLAARLGADSSAAFYDLDGVGSVVGLTSADGALANSYGYTPFGISLWREETIANAFEFNGGWGVSRDDNGLIYMRARSYDAEVGRFLSEDPLWLSGDTENLYRFSDNNNLNYIDPDGKITIPGLILLWGLAPAAGAVGYGLAVAGTIKIAYPLYSAFSFGMAVGEAAAAVGVGLYYNDSELIKEGLTDAGTRFVERQLLKKVPLVGKLIKEGIEKSTGFDVDRDLSRKLRGFLDDLWDTGVSEDISPNPPVPAWTWGDPHLDTFDGVGYSFQAVGEFTLVRGAGLEIQVRQEAAGANVSANTAVAMRLGEHVVGLYAKPEGRLLVNGGEVALAVGQTVSLGGGLIRRVDFWGTEDADSSAYEVINADGDGFWASVYGGAVHLLPFISSARAGQVSGLLGNADGNPANDFALGDGTPLPGLPDDDVLYGEFADSWRLTQETSMFVYGPGETTETFTDRSFPSGIITYATLEADLRAWAEAIVRAIGLPDGTGVGDDPAVRRLFENAVLDVALTGNAAFANVAAFAPRPDDVPSSEPTVPPVLPVIVGDTATTRLGEPVTIDVLANDSHPLGQALSILSASTAGGGLVQIVDGKIVFTPPPGFTGQANLSYVAGAATGPSLGGLVAVTVKPPVGPLFTDGDDSVDFNAIDIADHDGAFDRALDGNDIVVLPATQEGYVSFGLTEGFFAGAGNDTIQAGPVGSTIFGEDGNDMLLGGAGNDHLFGGEGADWLFGGAGDDHIDAGGALETRDVAGKLTGGQGNVIVPGAGQNTIVVRSALDIVDNGILFESHPGRPFADNHIVSHTDFWWDIYGAGSRLAIAEEVADTFELSAILGWLFDSEIVGNSGDNIIFSVGGDNVVRPGDGVDWIALGNIPTFRGVDTLVLEKGAGPVPSWSIVWDFTPGEDKVDVAGLGLASFAEIAEHGHDDGAGNSYYLFNDGADILFLVGLEKNQVSAGDFIV